MPRDYVYDQGFAEERARLRGMESLWDPSAAEIRPASTTTSRRLTNDNLKKSKPGELESITEVFEQ